MGTILDEIVAHKRISVAACKRTRPLSVVKTEACAAPPTRDFAGALRADGLSIIAEIKRQSPSKGLIREHVHPVEIAKIYQSNGARALSVLTDEPYFGGSLDDLRQVRKATSLPILRKDFIVDPYQIYEARAAGADAILLIVSILTDEEIRTFIRIARDLVLDALVEVHTLAEEKRALDADARIIGINNRDLKTLMVDLRTTLHLIRSIPEDRIIVSESGIRDRADLIRLQEAGIHAVLIGEALMSAPDIGEKLSTLIMEHGGTPLL